MCNMFLSYLLFTAIKPGFLQFFTGKKKSQYYLHIYNIHARDEFSGLFLSSCGRSPYPCDVDLLGC